MTALEDGAPSRPAGRRLEVLASPLSDLGAHYEVLVVGSGYGGSIAASRLSRAGREVALLERGRELHPGEFPRTSRAALEHMQLVGGDDELGRRSALFNIHVNGDINVLSGCGLGGTSLINANVSLRPDEATLADERWPRRLRDDRSGLDEGYRRAAEILQPVRYPEHYPPLAKVAALRATAGGRPFEMAPINVTFESGANSVGVHQDACNGCGDCVTGCNVGAKNTLLMNYLPDAVAHGARIFTEIEVRFLEALPDRWAVHAQPLGVARDAYHAPPLVITADVVLLAAGTLGSTSILLRSAVRGLPLSGRLGERFSGNGDLLGFSVSTGAAVNGVGAGPRAPDPDRPAGPCITAVVEVAEPGGSGSIIEDAVIPGAIAPSVPFELAAQALAARAKRRRGLGLLSLLESVLSRGRKGTEAHLQTFLVMGSDDDEGRVVLDGDEARVEWPGAGTSAFYERADRLLREMTEASGGTYLHDPIWTGLLRHDLMTVHPLGGCVMADDAEGGVVDDRGRVFADRRGTAVHDGLYVADGSIVPRPLGVNPLLTISALAERATSLLAAERGWEIDYSLDPARDSSLTAPAPPPAPQHHPGIRFTERMAGYWSPSGDQALDLGDFTAAADAGGEADRRLSFVLTIAADDVRTVIASSATPMTAVGTVALPALSGEPLAVVGGSFQLLVDDDADDPAVRHMRYHLPLVTTTGEPYHFEGFKVVRPGTVTDAWPATTTLYVTLRRDGPSGDVVGLGVLHIAGRDFVRQMRTMQVTGPAHEVERLDLLARFGRAFAGPLVEDFGTVVHRSTRLVPDAPPRTHRQLEAPPPRVYPMTAADGTTLRMTRYEGGGRGPVVLSHGMGSNPGLFTLDTIEPNLVEYLVANGYDVWLQEWRGSTWLPGSSRDFNGDDVARFDFPAAEHVVRSETGRTDVHWLCHCVGGITVSMAALAGTIHPASVVVSQVAAHPIGPTITELKARLHAAALIRATGIKLMTTDSYRSESLRARLFDTALRMYPIPKVERCDSAVCRRLAFIYGIAFHHPALNEATHAAIHELFGVTDLTMMNHLANCAAAERVLANDGSDAYLTHLDRLQFPFTFLHGAKNLVWTPESTARTHDALVHEFGAANYRRYVFKDHGHGDCMVGARAYADVYPRIVEHLERAGA